MAKKPEIECSMKRNSYKLLGSSPDPESAIQLVERFFCSKNCYFLNWISEESAEIYLNDKKLTGFYILKQKRRFRFIYRQETKE